MEEQRKPRAREKRVVQQGKGVEKKEQYTEHAGPVRPQERPQNPMMSGPSAQRPAGSARPMSGASGSARPVRPQQSAGRVPQQNSRPAQPFRPSQSAGSSAQPGRPAQSSPFSGMPAARPQQSGSGTHASRPAQTGGGRRMNGTASGGGTPGGTSRGAGMGGGCSSKLLMVIVALVVLLGGGKLSGLFDGGSLPDAGDLGNVITQVAQQGTTQTQQGTSGTLPFTGTEAGSSSAGTLSNLLSSFLSSGESTPYDLSGSALSSLFGGATGTQQASVPVSQTSGTSSALNEAVSSQAREKFTRILGGKKDTVTILVYLCGTDLESQNGMGTADLKEMAKAKLSDQVNLIVFTGGCRRWRNNVVSSTVNQIYQIRDGALYCLEEDMGRDTMTNPDTLTRFIRYGAEHFPANRMELILWDHGGGSVSGYGYDEKNGRSSMTLAGINTALKNAGVKFDFVGFDACLMATVENGIMLSQYADYMIASEETEPGVGWYYTNWLNRLSDNVSMPTIQVGQLIADDFVNVCAQQCRGQGTTLSVVDLAELQATVPKELKEFSVETNELIQNKEYKTISTARSRTREFAQSTRIDQIDLIHFATNIGSRESRDLAEALRSAVKYNRTGGGITNAYGLSIYFPYKRAGKVSQMVSTYQAIGMDEEYTRCIQEFASLELSGQYAAGTPASSFLGGSFGGSFGGSGGDQTIALPGLMNSLLGGSSSGGSLGGSLGGADELTDLLGGLFGGGSSSGGLMDLFAGRSMNAEKAAAYIAENRFDPTQLVWVNGRISLSQDQWSLIRDVRKCVYADDGQGFIELGEDNDFETEGNDLLASFDGTWLSIDGQPVAYYYLDTEEDGENYRITGYVPALLNGTHVNLLLCFDQDQPYGYIAGAQKVYDAAETETLAKQMIQVGRGDTLQFLCDYYDYQGNYQSSYTLGDPIVLGTETEIANTPIGNLRCKVNYCLTDIYQQPYWTPEIP